MTHKQYILPAVFLLAISPFLTTQEGCTVGRWLLETARGGCRHNPMGGGPFGIRPRTPSLLARVGVLFPGRDHSSRWTSAAILPVAFLDSSKYAKTNMYCLCGIILSVVACYLWLCHVVITCHSCRNTQTPCLSWILDQSHYYGKYRPCFFMKCVIWTVFNPSHNFPLG